MAGRGDNGRTAVGRGMAPWLAGFGAVAGAGAALGGYALLYEPFDVRAERLTVRLMRDRRGLPDEGLRILHISDTHFRGADRRERAKIEQVRRATADAQFDLLIHTGDFLHNDEGLENVLALFDSIPRPRIGAFAVTGNHDHVVYEMRRALHYSWRTFWARGGKCCDGATGKRALARRARLGSLLQFARYLLNNRFDGEPSGVNDIAGLRRALEGRGVRFLDNRAVRLEGTDAYVVGIEDLL
ncbi:MAG: metallophosphoesterase [Caldilineaceae bacterium]|nr:metallophosphoesterase [Caldilineaceae bacterium]